MTATVCASPLPHVELAAKQLPDAGNLAVKCAFCVLDTWYFCCITSE